MSNLGINNSNPSERVDVIGNVKATSNIYAMNFLGVATSNPQETLDVNGNLKARSNVYVLSNLGINNSNPSERVDVIGNVKATSNIYAMNFLGVATSNPQETLDVNGNLKARSNVYVLNNLGINNSNPTERVDITGNLKTSSNIYALNLLGIGNSNPTEALDVFGSIKVRSNVFVLSNLGINNSNPSERIDATGNVKASSNIYAMNLLGVATSNPQETLDVNGNLKARSNVYILRNLGVNNSNPTERIDVIGNLKTSSNIYALNFVGIGNSNPTEALDVFGSIKARSNIYILSNLSVNNSNPTEHIDVTGNLKASSNIYAMNLLGVATSNPTETLDVNGNLKVRSNMYILSNLGIATSNPTERFDVVGNVKASSNIYAMNLLGIATSNPQETLDVNGNLKARSNVYILSRLGIATSNPNVGLEVKTTDAILIPQGTTGQRPSVPVLGHIRYNSDTSQFEGFGAGNTWGSLGGVKSTDQQTYVSAEVAPGSNDGNIRFVNSNIETMRLTTNGFLGINTTSPATKLDVIGSTRTSQLLVGSSTLSNTPYIISAQDSNITNSSQRIFAFGKSATPSNQFEMIYRHIGDGSNNITSFAFNGNSNIVHINASGFVGIGKSNAQVALDIIGDVKSTISMGTSNITACNMLINGITAGTIIASNLVLANSNIATNNVSAYSTITSCNILTSNLYTSDFLGIGNSNPQYPLDVTGNAYISSNLIVVGTSTLCNVTTILGQTYFASNIGVGVSNPIFPIQVAGKIYVSNQVLVSCNDSLIAPGFSFREESNTGIFHKSANNIGIVANSNEIAFFNPQGLTVNSNVIVGSNISSSANIIATLRMSSGGLQVNRKGSGTQVLSSGSTSGFSNTSNGINLDIGSNTPASNQLLRITWSNSTEVMRVTGGGLVGINTSNPSYELHVTGTIYATGGVVGYSDKRAKYNLEPIQNALQKVSQLQGFTYNIKNEIFPRRHTGLLAQDLDGVLPEAIFKDTEGNMSIAYGNLAGLFVESIKELQFQNKQLQERLITLENKLRLMN